MPSNTPASIETIDSVSAELIDDGTARDKVLTERALASVDRVFTVVAVVPERALRAMLAPVRSALAAIIRELDQVDIRLRVDIRRIPRPQTNDSGAGTPSAEALERRLLDLVSDLRDLRRG